MLHRSFLVLVLLVLVTGCSATPSPRGATDDDGLADLFVKIAGRPEYSRSGATGVRKWQKPVRYAVIGDVPASARASMATWR